jgi:hypothetical protein
MSGQLKEKLQRLNLAVACVVAVAAVYSIGWYIYSPLTRPSLRDYEGFSSFVHSRWSQGDVIAVAPFWAERLREYAGDLNVINPPDLVDEDLSLNSRLWLLSVFGYAKDRDLLGTLSKKYRLSEEKRFGKLTLYLFELPPAARVVYDFRMNVNKSKVYQTRGQDRRECASWRDDHWDCGTNSWETVGRTILDVDDNPRRCIWAHPVTAATVNVDYTDVPLGRKLLLHTGLTAAATRMAGGAPVTVEVLIDGRQMLSATNENAKGWNGFEVDTSSMAGPGHQVAFRIRTQRDGMRHFCFTADTRD